MIQLYHLLGVHGDLIFMYIPLHISSGEFKFRMPYLVHCYGSMYCNIWWQDTQFLHILHESLDFFNIPTEEQANYFLVDTKTSKY